MPVVALLRPVSPVLTALVALALVLGAPPRLELNAAAIDTQVATQGLRARVGDLDDWTITVSDATSDATSRELAVEVWLRAPDGSSHRRRLPLAGTTVEDRSREVAASVALLIEQWDDRPASAPPPSSPPPARVADLSAPGPVRGAAPRARAWLGLGPRLELARWPPEGGVDILFGAWLLAERLQPLLSAGWSATGRQGLSLQTVRLGAGLAAGSPLARGRWWLGAHAIVHAVWARAHDSRSETLWASSSELGGTFQVRGARWFVGVRTGLDLALPELRIRGNIAHLRRGPVQWVLGVSFAMIFGDLRNSRGRVGR